MLQNIAVFTYGHLQKTPVGFGDREKFTIKALLCTRGEANAQALAIVKDIS
jgi:hypothetical protein